MSELDERLKELSPAKRKLVLQKLRGRSSRAPIPAVSRDQRLPLSFAQERLWFLDQMDGGSQPYNEFGGHLIEGNLDVEALRRSLAEVVRRHEILRTTFPAVDGSPVQAIGGAGASELRIIDLEGMPAASHSTELRSIAEEEAQRSFDLAVGPLWRVSLVRLQLDVHVLLLCMHHIICDKGSTAIVVREMAEAYESFRRGEPLSLAGLRIQYADFAHWQRASLTEAALQEEIGYWVRALEGAPASVDLPRDRPRPVGATFRGGVVRFPIRTNVARGIRELSRECDATLFMTLQAAFAVLLYRYSRQEDVVIGVPVASREYVELESLIGCFVNTLALRTDLSGRPSFREVLGRVRQGSVEAFRHLEVPFERVVEALKVERNASYTPLFQVMFAFENAPVPAVSLPGLVLRPLEVESGLSKFDLTLVVAETESGLVGTFEYKTDLFDRTTIERMGEHYGNLLESAVVSPDARISDLRLMGPAEAEQVMVGWNDTAQEFPSGKCAHHLFEDQVERTPDAAALVFGDTRLSYRELNSRANRLARNLRARGVGPEVKVGLSVERSPEMIAGLLGILKAGGAYVPLDPAYPRRRVEFMTEDSQALFVLTAEEIAGVVGAAGDDRDGHPSTGVRPGNLAYVIYTSGSTGEPKGVEIPHSALCNLINGEIPAFGLSADSRVLQCASLSFDASVSEIVSTLCSGGTLYLETTDALMPGRELANTLRERSITHVSLPPSALAVMETAELPDLSTVIVGGEACPFEVASRWSRGRVLLNVYGPTEFTVDATMGRHMPESAGVHIGRPVANARVYIVDSELQPVPIGVPGELCIGGTQLARGYLNRPALTAEKFVPDPFGGASGGRLYRTGDLCRYRPDGNIEFLGRLDDQVKVRGFRVETSEVEGALLAHPTVREAVVLAREDQLGTSQLVAYVVAKEGETARPVDLRLFLSERLPAFMIPSAVVVLEGFPLLPNQKIDRAALPAPAGDEDAARVAPRTPVEESLAGIWSAILGRARVGAHDNFFELGGHSLLATRVVSRIRDAFAVEIPLRQLFACPTIAGLAREIEAAKAGGGPRLRPPIRPVPRDGHLPLSFAQQRLWFLEQLEPGDAYNLFTALRLRGFEIGLLEASLSEIVRRHEILRTTFPAVDGVPAQHISPPSPMVIPRTRAADWEEVRRLAREEAIRPFDLGRGPLFRARILEVADDECVLCLATHHIVSDGWSMWVLIRELQALCRAFSEGGDPGLTPLSVQYADYAHWQREWLSGEVLDAQVDYWRTRLEGAPALLDLPTDRPRPAVRASTGAVEHVSLDGDLIRRLTAIGQGAGITLYMTVLAGFLTILSRYSRQRDIVVGSGLANRSQSEIEPLIGFFVNALPLRVDLSGNPTFIDLLGRVRDIALDAYMHQDVPLERLVEELQPDRSLSYTPLYQVMFAFQNAPGPSAGVPGLSIEPLEAEHVTAKFDLTVFFEETGPGLEGALVYSTALFDRESIRRMAGHLRMLLSAVAENPAVRIESVALLPDEERNRLLAEWTATGREIPATCLAELFEAQAAATPEAVAVRCGGEHLTYRQLNARSNQVGHYLQSLGARPETLIGLCIDRSLETIIAIVGIIKAGGAYLPLDSSYPEERLLSMVRDAAPPIIVVEDEHRAAFSRTGAQIVSLDRDGEHIARCPESNTVSGAMPASLAYVMYTSASTGPSKGVMIEQRSVTRLVVNTDYIGIREGDQILQTGSMAFDAATFDIWGALLNGGSLHLPAREDLLDSARLRRLLRDQRITCVFLTTAFCQQLVDVDLALFDGLEHVLFGGERLSIGHINRLRSAQPHLRITHVYGPTENTTFTTWFDMEETFATDVPIGAPIANTRVYILDDHDGPTPIGVIGELCTAGPGLARGYVNHPGLTSEKFAPDPFVPGERMYRTGDLARWRPDGNIDFAGRRDDQIKIRGFRVEPGEIQEVLNRHEFVRESVVVARANADGDRRLVAYVVPRQGAEHFAKAALTRQLRAVLEKTLPPYMVPSAFVALDSLPLTVNGKTDRRALPEPEADDRENDEAWARPRSPVEEELAEIFASVLRAKRVGVHENFFDIGGHSLLATQIVSRVRDAYAIELPLSHLFTSPTVAGLAAHVETARRASAVAVQRIPAAPRNGPMAPSFAQERLWFLNQLEPGNPFYNVAIALRLDGALDAAALERSLREIARRHETLRTVFAAPEGQPIQIIDECAEVALVRMDIGSLDGDERAGALERLAMEESRRPFDLAAGPLLRATLVRLGPSEHALLLTMHHIVADGWSLGVLVDELGARYRKLSAGEPPDLPPLPIQYADFAVWQRGWLSGEVLEAQLRYWKGQFAEMPPVLMLPADRVRPPAQSFRGREIKFVVDAQTTAGLRRVGREADATIFMTLLAAFASLLARYSGQDDIVIGSPVANRTRRETEALIGFFVNTLALRVNLSGEPEFWGVLERVRTVALEAYAHQDLPFERLVDQLQLERDLSLNPLFQVMFALQNAPMTALELPGLTIEPLEAKSAPALFDLVLDMWETGDTLTGLLEYNTDLFDDATAARMARSFETMLAAIAADPRRSVADLPVLSAFEEEEILGEGTGPRVAYPVDRPIHELFEAVSAANGDRIAAVHGRERLTYSDLSARSNRLARRLRRLGVSRGDVVGILDERGLDMLAAMLGILKAGGAFVPIDPSYPEDRVRYMVSNSEIQTVITRSAVCERFGRSAEPLGPRNILLLDRDTLEGESATALPSGNTGRDPAYMLYTSGSTGLPKGAIVRHDGAVNHIYAEFDLLRFHRGSAFLQSAPSSSDISVWQFLAPVLIGARTVIADFETVCDPAALFALIKSERVTLIELVPAVLRELIGYARRLPAGDRRLPHLEWAMATGEAVPVALINEWLEVYPDTPIVNAYGPTEAADDVCQAVIDKPLPLAQRTAPIGPPIANMCVYVLDSNLRLVPYGVSGEICVSGVGVGQGYWKNEERTKASFVPNPYAAGGRGDCLYRTGDAGRRLPGGVLECLERIDDQVKVRGFRIELGEIENALDQHPVVRANAVVVREHEPGDKQLVGYVVPDLSAGDVVDRVEAFREEQIGLWRGLHENSYRDTLVRGDATFNVIGWDSNYTGQPLPEADMREYAAFTVERICALEPRRVLDIGCGTGLIMFPLLPHCRSYRGSDVSSVAVAQLVELQKNGDLRKRIPGLETAELVVERADDVSRIEKESFDTAVLSSVVQYFPGIEYLVKTLEGLLAAIAPGGSIFLGDVRSLPLLEAFHASVQFHRATASTPLIDLIGRVRRRTEQEQELAVDPSFFAALPSRFPRIAHVEILPKRGFHHNEMTRFRYDVAIHLRPKAVRVVEPSWIDWRVSRWSAGQIAERLSREAPEVLALERVSNRRVQDEVRLLGWLAARDTSPVGEARERLAHWRATTAAASDGTAGIEPEELWAIGRDLPYRVDISLARGDDDGSFDVVFTKVGCSEERIAWTRSLASAGRGGMSGHANDPLREKLTRELSGRLREGLKQKLPNYMIPSEFVFLPALPVTPAGKVDRRALPAPLSARGVLASAYAAPETREERALARIWADVLGLERVGATDNFFELGGHSLKATRVVSRIHREMGADVALREVFTHPTIRELASRVAASASRSYAAIHPVPDAASYPLSHAERRLWVLSQMEDGSAAYNMPVALKLEGRIDAEQFGRAFDALVQRHESLRTAFVFGNGEPRQRVVANPPNALRVVDLTLEESPEARARQLALEDALTTFDLEGGSLVRASLLRLARDTHVLLFNVHHIVSDDWSLGVAVREFMQLYRSEELAPLRIQYRDYAHWQDEYLKSGQGADHRAYWHQTLAGELPVLNLPTDRPRPPVKSYNGRVFSFAIGPEQTASLAELGRRRNASLFMTLTAIVKVLLYRYTEQEDIIVGFPIAGRAHFDLEDQIGFYVNMLPLRDRVQGDATFESLLDQVRVTATGAYDHQVYPFDLLVDELNVSRDVSQSPMFDVIVVLQNAGTPELSLDGVRVTPFVDQYDMSKFDLSFTFEEKAGRLTVDIVYNTDLFGEGRIERMSGHIRKVVDGILADPTCPIARLDILPDGERRTLLAEFAPPGRQYEVRDVVQMFEAHAGRAPGGRALTCDGADVSYDALNRRANQLAGYLRALGVGPNVRVGLFVERSIEMAVGILGILKAGGAYVPVDPEYPPDRAAFMFLDSGVPVVLTQDSLAAALRGTKAQLIRLDTDWGEIARQSDSDLQGARSLADTAYVIYTSGSTGVPKGVLVSHRNLARLFGATETWFGFGRHDTWTLFHSCAFDFSVWEFWGALAHGGRLVIVPKWVARSPEAFYRLLVEQQVTVLNQTPSAFRGLMQAEEAVAEASALALRVVVFGGEALEPASLMPWLERHGDQTPRLINMYGITETTVHVTYRPITMAAATEVGSVIGVPIPDLQVHVLDRFQQPVPIGVPGELCIGGAGVAKGYLNRPELTRERFIPNPFGADPEDVLYRSGDLGRYRPNGELEYLGRMDHQVKIRGFRIELGEIESVLTAHPDVRESAVVARRRDGDTQLVAYVAAPEDAFDPASLRTHLRQTLPEYMVPSAFVRLDALPLTPNGKLDRKGLPEPVASMAAGYAAPGTEMERTIAAVLGETLQIDRVGIHDNFFDLGAHSLLLVRAHRTLRPLVPAAFDIVTMFKYPTVHALAQHLSSGGEAPSRLADVEERVAKQKEARKRRQRPA